MKIIEIQKDIDSQKNIQMKKEAKHEAAKIEDQAAEERKKNHRKGQKVKKEKDI